MPARDEFSVFHTVSTRWNDNDQYGHINNTVYYEYFDTAVNAWLSDLCGVLRSASFPAVLDVGIALVRLGRSSVTYQLAVYPTAGSEPHVVGRFVHVYVDPESRRPTAVPAEVVIAVGGLSLVADDARHLRPGGR
ncbi:thioesterase family protein [Streptomyces sp. NPDC004237]|uniref:acyl-CoA thioesterase n=1 Tax=Streptomyces sp. NPDC004237 TaxID=3154455 RepID=UPI0033B60688